MPIISALVSVITVCLNERERIEETINSIICQKCQNFEWIVIDGGSTDGTLDILNRYRDRMRVFVSEKDQGIYHAMNKGIRLAQGEYCLFMNGGDKLYDACAIGNFYSFEKKADYNYAGIIEVHGNEKIPKYIHPIKNLKDHLYKRSLPHQASYIRRELFEKYGEYDVRFPVIADQEFCKRAILKNKVSVQHLPWINSVFHYDGLSFYSKNTKSLDKEKKIIINKYFGRVYRIRFALDTLLSHILHR